MLSLAIPLSPDLFLFGALIRAANEIQLQNHSWPGTMSFSWIHSALVRKGKDIITETILLDSMLYLDVVCRHDTCLYLCCRHVNGKGEIES